MISETGKIYARRKIDVETFFGYMKASLGFTVRGVENVRKESVIGIMALNMMNLAVRERNRLLKSKEKRIKNLFADFLIRFFVRQP